MSNRDGNLTTTGQQSVLSQLEEFQKKQKAIEAAMGGDLMKEHRRQHELVKAALGGDLMKDYRKQEERLQSILGTNISEIQGIKKALGAGTNRNASPNTPQQKSPDSAQNNIRKADRNILSSVGDLGTTVRRKRKDMSLSQQQLADMTGVGRRFISELESGKPTLEFGRVLKVCQSIGIDLAAIER